MNTRPDGMQRRDPYKHELVEICERQFPHLDIFNDMIVDQLKEYIRLHGRCERSGQLFEGGPVEYDHNIPNAILYKGDKIDWRVLTPEAHAEKTPTDRKNIAKCDRLMGRTGQRKRRDDRKAKGLPPLIQGRKEIQGRGFDTPHKNYNPWKRKPARVKQLDESYE